MTDGQINQPYYPEREGVTMLVQLFLSPADILDVTTEFPNCIRFSEEVLAAARRAVEIGDDMPISIMVHIELVDHLLEHVADVEERRMSRVVDAIKEGRVIRRRNDEHPMFVRPRVPYEA